MEDTSHHIHEHLMPPTTNWIEVKGVGREYFYKAQPITKKDEEVGEKE